MPYCVGALVLSLVAPSAFAGFHITNRDPVWLLLSGVTITLFTPLSILGSAACLPFCRTPLMFLLLLAAVLTNFTLFGLIVFPFLTGGHVSLA